jgi:hypothetical protein
LRDARFTVAIWNPTPLPVWPHQSPICPIPKP